MLILELAVIEYLFL